MAPAMAALLSPRAPSPASRFLRPSLGCVNEAITSGSFAIIGTTLGWALSELGAGWRSRADRLRAERSAAQARVYQAAEAATALSEGIRVLVKIDVAMAIHGEGISKQKYEATIIELLNCLRVLRQTPLAISAQGPSGALAALLALVEQAQELWDAFEAAPRSALGSSPEAFLRQCDSLTLSAQALPANLG